MNSRNIITAPEISGDRINVNHGGCHGEIIDRINNLIGVMTRN